MKSPVKFPGNALEFSTKFIFFLENPRNVLEMVKKCPGSVQDLSMIFQDISWEFPCNVLEISRTFPRHCSGNVLNISRKFWNDPENY